MMYSKTKKYIEPILFLVSLLASFVLVLLVYAFWQHSIKKEFSITTYLKAQSISTPLFVFAREMSQPASSSCPIAFTDVTSKYQGRYIRIVSDINDMTFNKPNYQGGVEKPTYRVPVKHNGAMGLSASLSDNNGIHGVRNLATMSVGAEWSSFNIRNRHYHPRIGVVLQTQPALPPQAITDANGGNYNGVNPHRDVLIPLFCNGNDGNNGIFNCANNTLNHTTTITDSYGNPDNVGRYDNSNDNPDVTNGVDVLRTPKQKEFTLPRKGFRLCRWGI